jgi:hypothetical protein
MKPFAKMRAMAEYHVLLEITLLGPFITPPAPSTFSTSLHHSPGSLYLLYDPSSFSNSLYLLYIPSSFSNSLYLLYIPSSFSNSLYLLYIPSSLFMLPVSQPTHRPTVSSLCNPFCYVIIERQIYFL